jgi:hypothetical protein
MTRITTLWLAGVLVVGLGASVAHAQDDGGLGGLDADLLDQLTDGLDLGDDIPLGPSTEPEPSQPEAAGDGDPMSTTPGGEVSEPQPEPRGLVDPDHPLAQVSNQMRDVERWLRGSDSGERTRETQGKISDALAQLLELKQQQQQQSGQPQPGSPQSQGEQQPQDGSQNPMETDQPGPGEMKPDGDDNEDATESSDRREITPERAESLPPQDRLENYLQAEWGHLPERERQMVIQSFTERFLPQYDPLIRAYYERLSQPAER